MAFETWGVDLGCRPCRPGLGATGPMYLVRRKVYFARDSACPLFRLLKGRVYKWHLVSSRFPPQGLKSK
jgi:hypothetical protein